MQKHFSQVPEQNDWQEFKPLFGGGKIKICDTLRAVTPFGGLSVFIEFLGRIGLVEQLASRTPYQPKSGNHYDPGQILVGFILSVIAGAQRFAHTNQLRADRALHALLGMKRFPSDDTILNYFRRFSQPEGFVPKSCASLSLFPFFLRALMTELKIVGTPYSRLPTLLDGALSEESLPEPRALFPERRGAYWPSCQKSLPLPFSRPRNR